eukprot:1927807-Pleurochrysis_carterae.AAC.1
MSESKDATGREGQLSSESLCVSHTAFERAIGGSKQLLWNSARYFDLRPTSEGIHFLVLFNGQQDQEVHASISLQLLSHAPIN